MPEEARPAWRGRETSGGVATHDGAGASARELRVAEVSLVRTRRSLTELHGQGKEQIVGQAAYAVGSEETSHGKPPEGETAPSLPRAARYGDMTAKLSKAPTSCELTATRTGPGFTHFQMRSAGSDDAGAEIARTLTNEARLTATAPVTGTAAVV